MGKRSLMADQHPFIVRWVGDAGSLWMGDKGYMSLEYFSKPSSFFLRYATMPVNPYPQYTESQTWSFGKQCEKRKDVDMGAKGPILLLFVTKT